MQLRLRTAQVEQRVAARSRARKNRAGESTPKFPMLLLPRRITGAAARRGFLNNDVNYPRVAHGVRAGEPELRGP